MLIVLSIYALILYVVFGRFKWLPWNTTWKLATGAIGLIIALVVIGALNYLAPSGRVAIIGATIEITPNVSGTVVELNVEPNTQVQEGDLLFRIDPQPFEAEVARLEAALAEATAIADRLSTDLESADADIKNLEAQLLFGVRRRDDIMRLAERGATNEFQMQEAVSTIEQLEASLSSAEARKRGIEIRIAARVDGVDVSVVQAREALRRARWELAQTEVKAPSNGTVTAMTLRPGARVTVIQSALAFVPDETLAITGVFPQTGVHAFNPGDDVMVALRGVPGTSFNTTVMAVIPGSGEGVLPASGALPTIGQVLGSSSILVRLNLPEEYPRHATLLGMSGSATRITDEAGPVELLARVLFWVRMQANYL
ncbi:HlyD family secretion protein [Ruegeria arenilitoris]|uniref:HlyD family secretion protein n=1 Tax=Ruegeria arenilitoris TaxID=1173585 RepID=UPI00147A00C9|nr:biotin/lipoyl-binding protein [Ruegeria arenilitoris]